jgi:transposase
MQLKYHMVTIEDLVPENHFLRKLEAALDLSFVYEETAHLYSRRYGRAPIDKVFRRLFEEVVRQCVEKDLVSGRLAVTDSTHVKANTSTISSNRLSTSS